MTKLITVTEPHPVGERVVGVTYTHPESGVVDLRADAVVLTTGGFGFGQVSNSLLSKWTPWLDGMPTTNGSFATGEGVAMAEAAHATLVHMNQVQVHPTGFVDPADPSNPVKFLGVFLVSVPPLSPILARVVHSTRGVAWRGRHPVEPIHWETICQRA